MSSIGPRKSSSSPEISSATNSSSGFSTKCKEWSDERKVELATIWRTSTMRVITIAQDNFPMKSGFAKSTISVGTSPRPSATLKNPNPEGSYSWDPKPTAQAVMAAKVGQTIYVKWLAVYALRLEFGHSDKAPAGYMRIAVRQWPRVVREVTSDIRNIQNEAERVRLYGS